MNIFTDKDIKKLFMMITCILSGFVLLIQLIICKYSGSFNIAVLLVSFLALAGVLAVCFMYFHRQNEILEETEAQINEFLSGNTDIRIDCYCEGSLHKLLHAVNTLAASLNAHADNEQKVKEFLKGTISDISHQLKTPLAALSIYNGIMQDETENILSVRDFAAKSEHEIDRIEMLVQSLLKITKLDANSIIIEKSPENVQSMMNEIISHFEFRAKQEQKTVTLSGPEDAELCCDRSWITEAVSNLVKNALDHTDSGCSIVIEWKKLPTATQISVKDNGCGIHPEDLHHIFKRFYRSRFSKDKQGIGLGLPLAKAIIEAHDGSITSDSILGEGSIFVMNFVNLTKL